MRVLENVSKHVPKRSTLSFGEQIFFPKESLTEGVHKIIHTLQKFSEKNLLLLQEWYLQHSDGAQVKFFFFFAVSIHLHMGPFCLLWPGRHQIDFTSCFFQHLCRDGTSAVRYSPVQRLDIGNTSCVHFIVYITAQEKNLEELCLAIVVTMAWDRRTQTLCPEMWNHLINKLSDLFSDIAIPLKKKKLYECCNVISTDVLY